MSRKRTMTITLAAIGMLGFAASATAGTGVHFPAVAGMGDIAPLAALGAFAGTVKFSIDNHADKTKFFRIAKEGATTDGRVIERQWLEQMAASYDPVNVYGARVNLEHFKGIIPDSPFKAYGDVLALETREEADGKLALYAQIKPTADLVAMTKAGQKVYTSCEINPKFADTGKAYLVGLAVTDNPASLGTEMLTFAAKNPTANPLAKKKSAPDNLFTAADEELVMDMETKGLATLLLSKVNALLGKHANTTDQATAAMFSDVSEAVTTLATHTTDELKNLKVLTADQAKSIKELKEQLTAVTEKLAAEPDHTGTRPLVTGGSADVTTDC